MTLVALLAAAAAWWAPHVHEEQVCPAGLRLQVDRVLPPVSGRYGNRREVLGYSPAPCVVAVVWPNLRRVGWRMRWALVLHEAGHAYLYRPAQPYNDPFRGVDPAHAADPDDIMYPWIVGRPLPPGLKRPGSGSCRRTPRNGAGRGCHRGSRS